MKLFEIEICESPFKKYMVLWLFVQTNVNSEKATIVLVMVNFREMKRKINKGEEESGQSLEMPNQVHSLFLGIPLLSVQT